MPALGTSTSGLIRRAPSRRNSSRPASVRSVPRCAYPRSIRIKPERAVTLTCQLLGDHNWCPPLTLPLPSSANSAPRLATGFNPSDRYVAVITRDGSLFAGPSKRAGEPVVRVWSKDQFEEIVASDAPANPQLVESAAFSRGGNHMLVVFAAPPVRTLANVSRAEITPRKA